MSFSAPEGAENTEDELSSSDLYSSSDCNHSSQDEEFPLQEDVHQANLIAIHITDKKKKGEGELRYIKVSDNDEDDDEDKENDEHIAKKQSKHKISNKHKLAMFPLGSSYPQNDTFILIAFMSSMVLIFVLIIVIPILNQIVTTLNFILFGMAILCAVIGIFLDGSFYLAFNYETKKVYIQQQQCVGNCICGNKGIQGKLLGDFEHYKGVKKVKINDFIGESKKQKWQFIVTFKDEKLGDQCTVLVTSMDEDKIDQLESEINEWWQSYDGQNSVKGAENLEEYH